MRILVGVPTYNEVTNLKNLVPKILGEVSDAAVLIVDDASPDGTGQVADRFASQFPDRVFVVHRDGKFGIGSAHRVLLRWAVDREFDILITMDCDFTHDPRYLKSLLGALHGHDLVVGSRHLEAASMHTWGAFRRLSSQVAHVLTGIGLRIPFDATNAFRCYRMQTAGKGVLSKTFSSHYAFFFETALWMHRRGFRVKEISTQLPNRAQGKSKMTKGLILRWGWRVGMVLLKDIGSAALRTVLGSRRVCKESRFDEAGRSS